MKYCNLLFLIAASLFMGCSAENEAQPGPGTLTIEIDHVVGTEPLVVYDAIYHTPAGDEFTVWKLKYYLSNFTLRKADGTTYKVPESYYLVNAFDPETREITLENIPAGNYTSLDFMIGIDSARTVSGVQTGPIDPEHEMYWGEESGYVFLKLEGTSPQAPNGRLAFHVGGYQEPNNALRTISPSLHGATLQIRQDRTPSVHLQADVMSLFTGPNPIRFGDLAGMKVGPYAMKMADNYAAGMMTVEHVHAN